VNRGELHGGQSEYTLAEIFWPSSHSSGTIRARLRGRTGKKMLVILKLKGDRMPFRPFRHKHYVPILKGKRAEFPALGLLDSKELINPSLGSSSFC
jgi:hypothetical protein